MAAVLVPDARWSLIRPFPAPCRSRKVVDHVYPTGLALRVFCSYSEVAFPGPDAAETIGLRFWNDLLAAFTRLAACRNSGPDALRVAELAFS